MLAGVMAPNADDSSLPTVKKKFQPAELILVSKAFRSVVITRQSLENFEVSMLKDFGKIRLSWTSIVPEESSVALVVMEISCTVGNAKRRGLQTN